MTTMNRRNFLRLMGVGAANTALMGGGLTVYSTHIEPHRVVVEQLTLTLPRLDPAFDGFRLVQLSDLHVGGWITQETLESVIQQVNDLAPDMVAITGDFVSTLYAGTERAVLRDTLRQLNAPTFACLGNHDHWTNARRVRNILETAEVMELNNAVYSLQRGTAQLNIAGLDDIWERQHDLGKVLTNLPSEGATILLAHEPDYADTAAATNRFDLQLSGHSHGGQVRLPFIGAPILPPLGEKYPIGLYNIHDMHLYTNRGIGMGFKSVRFNCPPEITLFTLQTT